MPGYFTVVGMNAIFIYLFFETVGLHWLNGIVAIFTGDLLKLLFGMCRKGYAALISAIAALGSRVGAVLLALQKETYFLNYNISL
jgi:methionine aminopeptidase